MLLRRVMEHVKAQNWTAVALDFFIVVVGVFIGIQVANWNDARVERSSEAQFLVSLEQDMKESIAEVDDIVRQLRAHDQARETLYNYSLGERDGIDPPTLSKTVHRGLWSFASMELRLTTFDTLRSSGRLGILGDDALVLALQDLAALIDEAEFEEAFEMHALERFTDPYLYQNVDMGGVLTTPSLSTGEVFVPWLDQKSEEFTVPSNIASQELRNGILIRSASANERIGSLEKIRDKCAEISARIIARLDELGAR